MNFKDWNWDWTRKQPAEIKHEAFQPTDEQRECGPASPSDALLESEKLLDAAMDAARAVVAAHEAQARPTARVFLIRSPRVPLYPLALYFKARGYRLKQDGRGYIEVTR